MPLSLKLELKSNHNILVTNSETNEHVEVTSLFLNKITGNPLSEIALYKYYEIVIDAKKHWSYIKRYQPELEEKIIKDFEIDRNKIKCSIQNQVKQQAREEAYAKKQKWDRISAYKKAQQQWQADSLPVLLKSKMSYNKALVAIEYANFCLENNSQ